MKKRHAASMRVRALVASVAMVMGLMAGPVQLAWATTYDSGTVAASDLAEKDILKSGVAITTDSKQTLTLNKGRYQMDGEDRTEDQVVTGSVTLGKFGALSFESHTFTPQNEDGSAGDSWVVASSIKQGDNTDVHLAGVTTHVHVLSYEAATDTITATCTGEGDCSFTDRKATLKIGAPEHETYGDEKSPEATITDENKIQGDAKVSYYKAKSDGSADGSALPAAPTDAGKYRAEITLGEDADAATAYVTYTIAKAKPEVTAPKAKTLSYTGKAQELVTAGTTTGGKLQYSLDNKTYSDKVPTGTEVGDYTVWYRVKGDENYEDVKAAKVDPATTIARKSIADATITLDPNADTFVYNGKEQGVAIKSVKVDGTELVADTDYELDSASVLAATNVGTYEVKVNGKGNYTDSAATIWYITEADMKFTAESVSVVYDGKAHGIKVSVTEPATGATIKYGTKEGTYDQKTSPTQTNAGKLTVYYEITADNYKHTTGSAEVLVEKASIKPKVTLKGWTAGKTANEPTVTGNTGNGKVTYTYAKKGSTDFSSEVPTEAGTYTIKASIEETTNYKSGEATSSFTIAKAASTTTKTSTTSSSSSKNSSLASTGDMVIAAAPYAAAGMALVGLGYSIKRRKSDAKKSDSEKNDNE